MGLSSLNSALSLAGRIFDTHQAVKPILTHTSEKPARCIAPMRQPFPRCTPEEVGISSDTVSAFLRALRAEETLHMHSVLILRNGSMIAEATFEDHDTDTWKHAFSISKSVVSLAIGILMDEGKLSPKEKLTDILDSRIPPLSRLAVKDLTVRHLLTMATGASFNELTVMTERDWIKGYFNGTFDSGDFAYNSLNTYLLTVILTERAGMSLCDYLKPRLFEPLGISNYYWETAPSGIEKGGWGLYIRPEDLAKLGQLVLNDGIWHEKQLISAEYLRTATTPQITTGTISERFDYGWQIWTGREKDSFLFNGMLGQNVLGYRNNGILLVSHGGNDELFQSGRYFDLTEEYFSGDFPASPLPPNEAGSKTLAEVLTSLKDPRPDAKKATPFRLPWKKERPRPALPSECRILSEVRFDAVDDNAPGVGLMPVVLQAVQNNYAGGLIALSFLESGDAFYMTYAEAGESYLVRIGFGEAAPSDLTFHGIPYHVRTLGRFTRDEDGIPLLKLRIHFTETPMTRILKLYYTGASPVLKQTESPGQPFILEKALHIKRELGTTPIIGDTVHLVDDDYIRYRLDRKLSPRITLRPSKVIRRKV